MSDNNPSGGGSRRDLGREPTADVDAELRAARPAGESLLLQQKWSELQKSLFGAADEPVRLGRFVILDRLGQGGMGVVYSAYDPQLDRRVALKLVRAGHSDRARNRLLREAQALARVSHPNVVPVHEVGTMDDGRVFIVMEFVSGQTLRAWVEDGERSWREVLAVYRQAGEGLAAAHAQGMIHRDFKPDNAVIGEDGRVRVLDFGLARGRRLDDSESWEDAGDSGAPGPGRGPENRLGSEAGPAPAGAVSAYASTEHPERREPGESRHRAGTGDMGLAVDTAANPAQLLHADLTATGAIMGTPAYMSPEQLEGARATGPATDQFSFCVALYQALYGARPFVGDDLGVLTANVLAGRVVEPHKSKEVPGWVFTALRRGLATRPEDRHGSMRELLDALDRDPARARRRWLAAAAALALAAVSAFALAREKSAVPVCEGAEEELAATWNPERRAAIDSALRATGRSYAKEEALPLVLAGLDAYAGAWTAMHREACLANQRGHQSDALLDRRMTCLAKRRAGLASAVQVLTETDAESIIRSVDVVQGLRPIAYCADTEALEAEVPPPEDPVEAEKVADLRRRLTRVKALDRAGRYSEALELAEALEAEAEGLDYPPIVAEILLAQGSAHINKRFMTPAVVPLYRAMLAGFESGAHDVALEALARRIYAQGAVKDSARDALVYAPLAEALAEQVPNNTYIKGLLLNNIGTTYLAQEDRELARSYFERAIVVKEAATHPDPVELGNSLFNLALVTSDDARRSNLLRRSVGLLEGSLGSAHPNALDFKLAYAHFTLDPDAAIATIEPVCRARERHHRDQTVPLSWCLYSLGQLHIETGDIEGAVAAFAGAADVATVARNESHDLFPVRKLAQGYLALQRGEFESAIAEFAAIATTASSPSLPWWIKERIAQAHLGTGLSQSAIGRHGPAAQSLDRALTMFQHVAQVSHRVVVLRHLARTRTALARALWSGVQHRVPPSASRRAQTRARAAELMKQAEDWYRSAGAGYERHLDDVARWRREHTAAP